MASRNLWRGSISFGLVNIPVQVFVATQNEYSSFNQLDEKGHRIRYKKWCPVEEREVPWSEIQKGYEISKDNYVILEKEDLEKIKLKTTHTIDINEFINSDELDPLYIEKNYYIGPDDRMNKNKANSSEMTNKAYSLFVKILNETNKIAIGKVVLKDKEHLVALRPYQRGLVMHQLKYLDEIRPMDEIQGISADKQPKVEERELSLGKTLVENLTNDQFDIGKYSDAYIRELEKLIVTKSKGQKFKATKEEKLEETTDLVEALKASINVNQKSKSK
ncbi:MAG: Ku protein [Nitrososphaeraceae archaeon]